MLIFLVLLLSDVGSSIIVPKNYDLDETDPMYWYRQARRNIQQRQLVVPIQSRPVKNVILFLGDGMGISTITASRILKGQIKGYRGEEAMLEFDHFPHSALIKTYNVDQQIPDSAATATAFLAGVKNHFRTIGVSAKVIRDDPDCDSVRRNSMDSIFKWALDSGKVVGVVTTTRITHATPAAAYAHIQNRKWEANVDHSIINGSYGCKDIALQLIEDIPGKNFSVVLGGGRKSFLPKSIKDPKEEKFGERNDGRNLIEEWIQNQQRSGLNESEYAFINSTRGLRNLNYAKLKYLFGLFNYTHMEFDPFRNKGLDGEPSLSEMTEAAIRILSKHENGFILLVEGGLIDQAHHSGYASLSLYETLEFDRAIQKARQMLPKQNTLILVTADHSQSLVINGYSPRGNPINGTSTKTDVNNWPYTTLMYTNGPGYKNNAQRSNITNASLQEALHDLKYRFHSAILLKKSFHSGEDVAIFGTGPMSHLFGGTLEQSYIAHAIGFASCIGPYQNEIHCRLGNGVGTPEILVLLFIMCGMVMIILILILAKMLRPY